MIPPPEFQSNAVDPGAWSDLDVPGEPWMSGHSIDFDVEYPYKRKIAVPDDFADKRVFLRFEGIYSRGRVWVNGNFAGEHEGGFTSWQLDITEWVTPGESAWLTVGITDLRKDLSFGSGYAGRYLGTNDVPHRIGGILRGVTLFAVPNTHVTRLHVETDLDANYRDATLKVDVAAAFPTGAAGGKVRFSLRDPDGKKVPLSPFETVLAEASPESSVEISISNPLKWDAEHPHLYTLQAELLIDGQVTQSLSKKVGFREIEMVGNQMLVNGQEVKLRGGCRHSIHPLAGRADVEGLDETDVLLYKKANINYVRTSHYPTTERFLDLCDQYGLYVEEEMAICWIDHHAAKGVLDGLADDPAVRPQFMAAISETIERDRSHPSIIMWSLGNENITWGANFEAERDYARKEDPTRPLKTGHNHYGGGWNSDEYLDIDSYHYPSWNTDFNKTGKPYLFDEYCHVMTYYRAGSIAEMDPNIRNFWGESLKRFWDEMFPSKGTLGAAIWGTVDEVFLTPDAAIGYGRWGIFDGWRRPKPEYWLTKKGYSPIRIDNEPIGNPGEGKALHIPIKNWFDHTNLNELEITWEVGEESGSIKCDLVAHGAGELILPGRAWKDDDVVTLRFTATQPGFTYLVDELHLPLQEQVMAFSEAQGPAPALKESADEITVTGGDFEIIFDKAAGSIKSGVVHGDLLLTGGPALNLAPYPLAPFAVAKISARAEGPSVVVDIIGAYGSVEVAFKVRIDGSGLMETTYTVKTPPDKAASYAEVGVAFALAPGIDRLEWARKGLYSVYPEDHIGRNHGAALMLRPGEAQAYRQEPDWSWALDMKEFHQHGPEHEGYGMTNDFRGAKEAIHHASAVKTATGNRVRVESNGEAHAVRMEWSPILISVVDDRDPALRYSGNWTSASSAANHAGTERYTNAVGASVEYDFNGTSVRWIGARNRNHGKVDVYLDGTRVVEGLDAYAPSKQFEEILFEMADLTDGRHVLKVVVRGDKNPEASDNYTLIDGFSEVPPVLADADRDLRINVNRQWAYNLGWGNYGTKSEIEPGFSDTVRIRLIDAESFEGKPEHAKPRTQKGERNK